MVKRGDLDNVGIRPKRRIDVRRLLLLTLPSLAVPLVFYVISEIMMKTGNIYGLFSLSFLVLVPFTVTLLSMTLVRRYWGESLKADGSLKAAYLLAHIVIVAVFLVASPFLICLTIGAPYWLLGLVGGFLASRWVVKLDPRAQNVAMVAIALMLPLAFVAELTVGFPQGEFVTSRSVLINASADQVWPHLLRLDQIDPKEGLDNFSQSILQVPRPLDAIVVGEGVSAVRTGHWENNIWFEEHIIDWVPNELLEWKFVFPDGSQFTQIDQHIDPRGPALVVETGSYEITELPNGGSELKLRTRYKLKTAMNGYGRVWGEIILGDIQRNILTIVKARSEDTVLNENDDALMIAENNIPILSSQETKAQ